MNRLKDINRTDGYPLCTEVLGVLSENGELLDSLLKWLPLQYKTAVFFKEHDYMVVCERDGRNRIVKVGTVSATDLSSAMVTITRTSHSVTDSLGNTIEDVWRSETASIVTTNSDVQKWTFLEMKDVIGSKMWTDKTTEFENGLSASSISGNGHFVSMPALYGHNKVYVNEDTLKLYLHIKFKIAASSNTVLHIPFYNDLGGYFRMNANLQMVGGGNYPVRALINSNEMVFNIGRWIQDENMSLSQGSMFELVIDINENFELW